MLLWTQVVQDDEFSSWKPNIKVEVSFVLEAIKDSSGNWEVRTECENLTDYDKASKKEKKKKVEEREERRGTWSRRGREREGEMCSDPLFCAGHCLSIFPAFLLNHHNSIVGHWVVDPPQDISFFQAPWMLSYLGKKVFVIKLMVLRWNHPALPSGPKSF